ncbi:thiol reductant ABC exporter subunit CydC [Aciduricibacillus chroicocephali]|uniref:Thiol reductant ABC exporter subunit CydC n=1 Tax=Aciduricibacillus chroicocephali TaxID=3054939 RepID=A0ABY9KW82_9BACI|nr:thiol reductant ABC exporter subunit CydC [Bacillaceae bacterium 44XB]
MHDWIIPYVKQYKSRVALALFFSFLGVASGALLLFVSGYLISKSALRPENVLLVYVPIVSVRAFSIGQAVFPYLEKLVGHDIVLRILAKYRHRLYDMLEPQAVFLEGRYQTGDILNVLSDDIERLQDFYIRTLLPTLSGIFVYAVIAVMFGFFDLPFMLLTLALLGIIVFLVPLISYRLMKKQHLQIKRKRGSLYQHITDAMFGQFDWLASGRVGEVLEKTSAENKQLLRLETKVAHRHHMRDAMLRLIAGLAIIAVMIWANIQTNDGTISATLIAAFTLMMFSVTDALIPISPAVEEIPSYREAIERMSRFEIEDSTINDTSEKIPFPEHPVIQINNVSYAYGHKHQPVLDQFSLRIEPGSKIAILGKSGTGKSTLLKLLAGMIEPDSGEVSISNESMSKDLLGKAVSVLNQKPHLFHTTVANNVRMGKPDATDTEVIAALEKVQMMDLLNTLPEGIHTQMDEMGERFSGGERQRIAFARVLLQNTPIILLDEPTTGLDPRTESNVLQTMLAAAEDKTIIWVTHHLVGAQWVDEVIFMEKGAVKLKGNHEQLLSESTYYRSLYEMDRGI